MPGRSVPVRWGGGLRHAAALSLALHGTAVAAALGWWQIEPRPAEPAIAVALVTPQSMPPPAMIFAPESASRPEREMPSRHSPTDSVAPVADPVAPPTAAPRAQPDPPTVRAARRPEISLDRLNSRAAPAPTADPPTAPASQRSGVLPDRVGPVAATRPVTEPEPAGARPEIALDLAAPAVIAPRAKPDPPTVRAARRPEISLDRPNSRAAPAPTADPPIAPASQRPEIALDLAAPAVIAPRAKPGPPTVRAARRPEISLDRPNSRAAPAPTADPPIAPASQRSGVLPDRVGPVAATRPVAEPAAAQPEIALDLAAPAVVASAVVAPAVVAPRAKPQGPAPATTVAASAPVAYKAPRYEGAGLANPLPRYPYLARWRGQEGRVLLRVLVSAAGEAKAVSIRQSSGYRLLDEAALKAIGAWRFFPARKAGIPAADAVDVPVSFRLTE